MGTYIGTRERIAKNDAELTEFLAISGYRFRNIKKIHWIILNI